MALNGSVYLTSARWRTLNIMKLPPLQAKTCLYVKHLRPLERSHLAHSGSLHTALQSKTVDMCNKRKLVHI